MSTNCAAVPEYCQAGLPLHETGRHADHLAWSVTVLLLLSIAGCIYRLDLD